MSDRSKEGERPNYQEHVKEVVFQLDEILEVLDPDVRESRHEEGFSIFSFRHKNSTGQYVVLGECEDERSAGYNEFPVELPEDFLFPLYFVIPSSSDQFITSNGLILPKHVLVEKKLYSLDNIYLLNARGQGVKVETIDELDDNELKLYREKGIELPEVNIQPNVTDRYLQLSGGDFENLGFLLTQIKSGTYTLG